MAHWHSEHKAHIAQLLADNCCIAAFVGVGNNGTTTQNVFYFPEQPDIIIGFNSNKDCYYIWNAYLHKTLCRVAISDRVSDDRPIKYVYSPLQNGHSEYEKKLIVHKSRIEYFCNHWLELLTPNAGDDFSTLNCVLWADKENPTPKPWTEYVSESAEEEYKFREKIATMRYTRDSSFSKRIKDYYGYQCAVCRCSIVEILEAAHIRAVKDFGNDSLKNGICLCRNHHKLYDDGLLELNGDFTFTAVDERLRKDDYFMMVYETYKGKLIVPKYIGV